jgi:hypothetical protein
MQVMMRFMMQSQAAEREENERKTGKVVAGLK